MLGSVAAVIEICIAVAAQAGCQSTEGSISRIGFDVGGLKRIFVNVHDFAFNSS